VDFRKMASVSRPAPGSLDDITVRAAFLGVHGISPAGIGMLSPEEAAMNRAFIDAAQTVNVLVDSSKFNSQAIFRICEMNRVTRVVTDTGLAPEVRQALEA
ncbi:DeoR/GlpR transcriptional regulator, partial [Escherichia coli]|nr:DeoR/GlpR transcriptional regulator [Escherichia coli]